MIFIKKTAQLTYDNFIHEQSCPLDACNEHTYFSIKSDSEQKTESTPIIVVLSQCLFCDRDAYPMEYCAVVNVLFDIDRSVCQ